MTPLLEQMEHLSGAGLNSRERVRDVPADAMMFRHVCQRKNITALHHTPQGRRGIAPVGFAQAREQHRGGVWHQQLFEPGQLDVVMLPKKRSQVDRIELDPGMSAVIGSTVFQP